MKHRFSRLLIVMSLLPGVVTAMLWFVGETQLVPFPFKQFRDFQPAIS